MYRREFCRQATSVVFSCGLASFAMPTRAFWYSKPLTWAQVDAMIESEFPSVPHITTAQFAEAILGASTRLVIDVRGANEFSVSHLAAAQRADSIAKINALIEQNSNVKQIVLYCSVGYRSAKFVQQLRKQGLNNSFNLKGSLFAWANEGRPVYVGLNRVEKVHPFDRKWGELLKPELRFSI
jgi:rhodanese-related sulfurtransferase